MQFPKEITTFNEAQGKAIWGKATLPSEARIVGTIVENGNNKALIKLGSGMYASGLTGKIKLLGAIHEESRTPR